MAIYTRQGDQGQTSDLTNQRYSKDALQVVVLGHLDELNVTLGMFKSSLQPHHPLTEIKDLITELQKLLLSIGSEIAGADTTLSQQTVQSVEQLINHYEHKLPTLDKFILPGGSITASYAHLARVKCRELERHLVSLDKHSKLNPNILAFTNRLSDLLFVIARWVNQIEGFHDHTWSIDSPKDPLT